MAPGPEKHGAPTRSLIVLQWFIGVGAVAGGMGLVTDPSGAQLGMTRAWLEGSPFSTYLVPGLVLLVGLGLGHLVAGLLLLRGIPHAREVSLGMGLGLVLWIMVQMAIIPFHWLQPVYLALGCVEGALALTVRPRGA